MKTLHFIMVLILVSSCKTEFKEVIEKYTDGQPKEVHVFPEKENKKDYQLILYFQNGQIEFKGTVKNKMFIGQKISYYENGNLREVDSLLNSCVLDSCCCDGKVSCFDSSGRIKKIFENRNGLLNGNYVSWFDNGQLSSQGQYSDGKLDGIWTYWEKNGTWKIRTYKIGCLDGITKEHLVDSVGGIIISLGQYQNCKENGPWKWYDKDSTLYQTATYVDGKIVGEYKRFYKNGVVELSGYLAGENTRDGTFSYFDTTGKLTRKEIWKNGIKIR